MSDPTGYGHLLGTRWRNKRSGKEYRVAMTDDNESSVFLLKLTMGGRSTWKYAPHLPFDYEEIKDGV